MTSVSVIIPCYNHAAFLGDAIASVRRQSWPAVETIVVDDGSTDESRAVAQRAPRIRLISQDNQGLSAARNAGLRASSGDVIIFLDADDVLLPNAAEAAVGALTSNPAALMVFGRLELMDLAGRWLDRPLPDVRANFYEEFLRRNYIRTPAMAAFPRRAFDLVGGFDRACSPSADYDLYLRITRQFSIARHDALVARYRQHDSSMSRDARLMLPATLLVLERQRVHVQAHPALAQAYRFGLRRCREFYGERLVEQFRAAVRTAGRRREAVECALDLLRWYPRGVLKHAAKKLSLTFGYAGRATPEAETVAPSARASTSPGRR